MHRWEGIIIAGIIGISLVAGTLIVAQTIDFVKTFNNSQFTVTGSTQEVITSDEVKWTGQFSRETPASDLKSGYAAMQKDRADVEAFLRGQGVSGSAVTISPITLNPVYNNCAIAQKIGATPGQSGCVNQIVSYRLVENVEVDSSNVQKVTSLAEDSSTLINQGVVFSTTGLKYYDTKLSGLREKLLAAATKDAQLRAQGIAASTGMKIGHLLSVNTGVIQITPVNSTQVSSVGVYDTSTIQKKITAVVRASFTLEQ